MCDRFKGHQDTDLASFIKYDVNENLTQHVALCEVTITTAYRCPPSRSRASESRLLTCCFPPNISLNYQKKVKFAITIIRTCSRIQLTSLMQRMMLNFKLNRHTQL